MKTAAWWFLFPVVLQAQSPAHVFENDHVRIHRDSAPCASATANCGDRIIVPLTEFTLAARGRTLKMERGGIAAFPPGESYIIPAHARYFEVVIKGRTPPPAVADTIIPAEGNHLLYDGERFFVFEEHLPVGETRPRHSHNQRVVVQLNRTRLLQQVDGQPEVIRDIEPNGVAFNAPVIHTSRNIGDQPLHGIVIEFKKP
ncbi:MAG: hypothetical protein ACRENU_10065 [Gemmatimonadaceae bacterium]